MAHELESMFFTGTTPWHGLGLHLDVAPASTAEAVKLAGLDWEIALEQLQLADGTAVDRNAVVRQSDRAVLGTVGMGWEPIQNRKAFEPFDPFIAAGVATIETAGSLRGGKRVWMLARVNRPDSVIVRRADDRVAKYLLVAVGHDGTLAFRLGYTPTRVVCMNTLSVALDQGESTHVRIPHVSGAAKAIEAVAGIVGEVDARFERTAEVFRALARRKIRSEAEVRAYIDAVYPPAKPAAAKTLAGVQPARKAESFADLLTGKATIDDNVATYTGKAPVLAEQTAVEEQTRLIHDQIIELFQHGKGNDAPGVKGTAWALYNGVTEYMTWHRGKDRDVRLDNLWMEKAGSARRALPAAVSQFLSA